MKDILVSVVMITYEHEMFIKDAIQGVLIQEFSFGKVELIIADDCSSDRTENVVDASNNVNPNIEILYTKHKVNKGVMENLLWALSQAQGKYIALCEGDDYWIDKNKLQKQVEFLEKNPSFAMCGAIAQRLIMNNPEGLSDETFLGGKKSVLNTKDFLSGYPIHTSTVLMRSDFLRLPKWLLNVTNGDVALFSLLSEKGPVGFLQEKVSIYRVTGTGLWSGTSLVNRYYAFKNTVNHLNKHFRNRYKDQLRIWEFKEAQRVSSLYLGNREYYSLFSFCLKNYHRYFWHLIFMPTLNEIASESRTFVTAKWIKFRMYMGIRTRLRKMMYKFSNKDNSI